MTDKAKEMIPSAKEIMVAAIGAAMVVGVLIGSGFLKNSSAMTSSALESGNYVSRSEFIAMRAEEREDKQILFRKIDKLTEKLSQIAQGLARIEGSR